MSPDDRSYFDEQLEHVLSELPLQVSALLDDVPLFVEDYPARDVMESVGVKHRRQLCGIYTGVPLIDRSVRQSGILSDVIHLFREGIMHLAAGAKGRVDRDQLRRQIRITILHEFGHHHGLGERELRELGY